MLITCQVLDSVGNNLNRLPRREKRNTQRMAKRCVPSSFNRHQWHLNIGMHVQLLLYVNLFYCVSMTSLSASMRWKNMAGSDGWRKRL